MSRLAKRIGKIALRSPFGRRLLARLHFAPWLFVPPGHFYSPIPNLDEIRRDEKRFFSPVPRELPGIALNETDQLALLHELQPYYDSQPFHATKTRNPRYCFANPKFPASVGVSMPGVIRSPSAGRT